MSTCTYKWNMFSIFFPVLHINVPHVMHFWLFPYLSEYDRHVVSQGICTFIPLWPASLFS